MGIGTQVLRNSAFLLGLRTFQRTLGVLSTLVLARVLMPEDFGTVAIALMVVQFSIVVGSANSADYIVQADDEEPATVNTAWTVDIAFKSAGTALVLALLPAADAFWDNRDATLAIAALAPTLALESLQNPQLHVAVRHQDYSLVLRVQMLKRIVSFVVVVGLALLLESFWAIVIGAWASVLTATVASHALCDYRPRLTLERAAKQWQFSKWMLSRGYIGYARSQVDSLLVSKLFPLEQFGKFTMAREIAVMPANDIIFPATQPLLSSFARTRDRPAELRRQVGIALLVVTALVAPACAALALYADPVVALMLGDRWAESAPMIVALTPLLLGVSLGGTANQLLIALGRARALFWLDVGSLLLICAALYASRHHGLLFFIWVRSLLGLALSVLTVLYVTRGIGRGLAGTCGLLAGPVLAAVMSAVVVHALVPDGSNGRMFVGGALLATVYGTMLWALGGALSSRSEAWRYALGLVKRGVGWSVRRGGGERMSGRVRSRLWARALLRR